MTDAAFPPRFLGDGHGAPARVDPLSDLLAADGELRPRLAVVAALAA